MTTIFYQLRALLPVECHGEHDAKVVLAEAYQCLQVILNSYSPTVTASVQSVRRLVDSIQHGQFVQPVTIALYKVEEGMLGQNLIIDGQQ